ncbi:MAG: D-alanyl-D-alanine carboxypeptidase [Alphaproteobacteria bacterium]|nr:D-alanyl-D-alanine carboxypeptidase [Alphaproteobacteria bacterium]
MKKTLLYSLAGTLLFSFNAVAFDTKATHALLMDADTGYVMFEKDADKPMPPASMSKLMTVYIVFDALKDGGLKLEDEFIVSENAWRTGGTLSGGSTMFLKPAEKVKVLDLLKGVIIQSGNDACITIAENLAGSESAFAELMNEKAKELGLTNSTFRNSTGLPDPEHKMSAKDLAKLAQILIKNFPDYYYLFSEKSFKHNGITQGNRNPLLYKIPGADGLKTGHTKESGYGLTGSVLSPDGRRVILVVNGLSSMKERDEESRRLATYGSNGFITTTLVVKDKVVDTIPVWLGQEEGVDAVTEKEYRMTRAKGKKTPIIKISYNSPIVAPVKKGDIIATLKIGEGETVETMNLLAAKDVKKAGYFKRLKQTIKSWF